MNKHDLIYQNIIINNVTDYIEAGYYNVSSYSVRPMFLKNESGNTRNDYRGRILWRCFQINDYIEAVALKVMYTVYTIVI
jgi:hypothetical protein